MKKVLRYITLSILVLMSFFVGISSFNEKKEYVAEAATSTEMGISTASDLLNFFTNESENIYGVLENDIDLGGKFWIPRAMNAKTLDGNGYSIKNLTIDESITGQNVGFVSLMSASSVIKNIQFENVYISSTSSNVGIVAGNVLSGSSVYAVNIKSYQTLNGGTNTGVIAGTTASAECVYACQIPSGIVVGSGSYADCIIGGSKSNVSNSLLWNGNSLKGVGNKFVEIVDKEKKQVVTQSKFALTATSVSLKYSAFNTGTYFKKTWSNYSFNHGVLVPGENDTVLSSKENTAFSTEFEVSANSLESGRQFYCYCQFETKNMPKTFTIKGIEYPTANVTNLDEFSLSIEIVEGNILYGSLTYSTGDTFALSGENQKYVFAILDDQGTKIKIHKKSGESIYHSEKIGYYVYQSNSASISSTDFGQEIFLSNSFSDQISDEKECEIYVAMTSFYPVKIMAGKSYFVANGKIEEENTINSKNLSYSSSEMTKYICLSDNKLYSRETGQTVPTLDFNTLSNKTYNESEGSEKFPVVKAKGYNLNGFRALVHNVSSSMTSPFPSSTDCTFSPAIQDGEESVNLLISQLAKNKLMASFGSDKSEFSIYPTFTKRTDLTLSFVNTINKDSSKNWWENYDSESSSLSNLFGSSTTTFSLSYAGTSAYLSGYKKTFSNQQTETQYTLTLSQVPVGMEFKGLVISSSNGESIWFDSARTNSGYVKCTNQNSFSASLYGICGDVYVYAVFERDEEKTVYITAKNNGVDVDKAFVYDYTIYDYNGVDIVKKGFAISCGTATQHKIKAGMKLQINYLVIAKDGYEFSYTDKQRFDNTATQFSSTDYTHSSGVYTWKNLIKYESNYFGYVEIFAPVKLSGISDLKVVIKEYDSNSEKGKELNQDVSDLFPEFSANLSSNSVGTVTKNSSGYTVSQIIPTNTLSFSDFSKQNYYKFKRTANSDLQFAIFKTDGSGEVYTNSNTNIATMSGNNFKIGYEIPSGSGYTLVLFVDKVNYNIKIVGVENGKVETSDIARNAIPTKDNYLGYTYTTLEQTEFSSLYTDKKAYKFSPNDGYYVKNLKVNNEEYVKNGNNLLSNVFDLYNFYTALSPESILASTPDISIVVEFAPRNDISYTVKLYKEDKVFNSSNLLSADKTKSYTLSETINLSDGVMNSTVNFASVYQNRYKGFNLNTSEGNVGGTIQSQNNEFVLLFDRNIYTVVYTTEQGEMKTNKVKFEHTEVVENCLVTKTGFEFDYWQTKAGKKYLPSDSLVVNEDFLREQTITSNTINLTAVWKAKTFTITWQANEASNQATKWTNYVASAYEKVESNNKALVSKVVYGQKVSNSALLVPTRYGYDFVCWKYVSQDGEIQLQPSMTFNFTAQNITAEAVWKEKEITINFISQLEDLGISPSSLSKKLTANQTLGTLPQINSQSVSLDFVGFFTGATEGTLVSKDTLISSLLTSETQSINLYAHYTALEAKINFSQTISKKYTGKDQVVLEMNNTKLQNYNEQASYTYTFKKDNTEVGDNVLSLKNVADSGIYILSIKFVHEVWGTSQKDYQITVSITPLKVNFSLSQTKTYDMTNAFTGATDSEFFNFAQNKSSFDESGVGKRTITAVFENNQNDTIENISKNFDFYVNNTKCTKFVEGVYPSFKLEKIDGKNTLTLLFEGEIEKRKVTVDISGFGFFTGFVHKMEITNDNVDSSFLQFAKTNGLEFSGFVSTNSHELGVYGSSNVSCEFKVKKQSSDLSQNFEAIVAGNYEIKENQYRTIRIDKKASLNIEDTEYSSFSADAFVVEYISQNGETTNISKSNSYDFSNFTIYVRNDNNSNYAEIIVTDNFVGKIQISSNSFEKDGKIISLAKWSYDGNEIKTSSLVEDFLGISKNSIVLIDAIYRNYAEITFDFLSTAKENEVKRIYAFSQVSQRPTNFVPSINDGFVKVEKWFYDKSLNQQFSQVSFASSQDFYLYAKWEFADEIVVKNKLNGAETSQTQFEKEYNSIAEYLTAKVENASNYATYTFYVNSVKTTANNNELSLVFKNVIDSGEKQIRIEASIICENSQVKTFSQTLSFSVLPKQIELNKTLSKVYDGKDTILSQSGNYVLFDISLSDSVSETLKIVGTYPSATTLSEQTITNFEIVDNDNFLASNYQITATLKGQITQKQLSIDFGDTSVNNKIYDKTVFYKEFSNSVADSLASGDNLVLVIESNSSQSGVYAYETLSKTFTITNSSFVDVTNMYKLVSIKGSAEILKIDFDLSKITMTSKEVVFDGNYHSIECDFNLDGVQNNQNGLPDGVRVLYFYKLETGSEFKLILGANAPQYVGKYIIQARFEADDNYNLVGYATKSAYLTITPRPITLSFGQNVMYGLGEKTLDINVSSSASENMYVSNQPLVDGYTLRGTIKTNNSVVGTYLPNATGLSLVPSLSVYDKYNEDVTENFVISLNGQIKIECFYFISFHANGGEGSIPNMKVYYDQSAQLSINTFKSQGFEFDGWNTNIDGSGTNFQDRETILNLTSTHGATINLYAKWKPAQNKITINYLFETFEDEVFEKQSELVLQNDEKLLTGYYVRYDIATAKIYFYQNYTDCYNNQNPVKETQDQSSFEGFTISNTSQNRLIARVLEDGSSSLSVCFDRNEYTVTYNFNNGKDSQKIETYKFDSKIEKPQDPTYEGYTFDGWYQNYLDPDSRQKIENWNSFKMPAKDVILWANYINNPNATFSVMFYRQTHGGNYELYDSQDYNCNLNYYAEIDTSSTNLVLNIYKTELDGFGGILKTDEITLSKTFEKTPTGFTYTNYSSQVLSGFVEEEKLVLSLYFERNTVTLTFVKNNGEPNSEVKYKFNEQTENLKVEKVGYVFDGWFENYNSETGAFENKIIFPFAIKKDTTLYAKWIASHDTKFTLEIYLENVDGTFASSPTNTISFTSTTDYIAKVKDQNNAYASFVVEFYDQDRKVSQSNVYSFNGYSGYDERSIIEQSVLANGQGKIKVYILRKLFTVTFVLNNEAGETIEESVKFEQKISAPTLSEREGFNFGGWCYDENLSISAEFPLTITEDKTLYARWNDINQVLWKMNIYSENIDGTFSLVEEEYSAERATYIKIEQSGQEYFVRNYASDNTTLVKTLKVLSKTGYEVDLSNSSTNVYVDDGISIDVYFVLKVYKLTLHLNNQEPNIEREYKYTQTIEKEQDPSLVGFVFDGWFSDASFESIFNFENFVMPHNNVDVYAKYRPATDTKYTVEYYVFYNNTETLLKSEQGQTTTNFYLVANNSSLSILNEQNGSVVQTLSLSTPNGYTFIENYSGNVLESLVFADGSAKIKLFYSINSYSLTLHYNDNLTPDEVLSFVFTKVIEIVSPIRQGYTFAGWFYESTLSTKLDQNEQGGKTTVVFEEPRDYELFAKWTPNLDTTYVVNYYKENADDDNFTLFDTVSLQGETESLVVAKQDKITGFEIDENTENQKLSGNILPDGSLVLNVYYTRIRYTVKFDSNGGEGMMTSQTFKFEQTLPLFKNTFTKTGFAFDKWKAGHDESVVYADNEEVKYDFDHDITLFANWKLCEINVVSISPSKLEIYYGNTITIEAGFEHEAEVTAKYRWFKDDVLISKDTKVISLEEIAESGKYKCEIVLTAKDMNGVSVASVKKQTDEIEIKIKKRPVSVVFEETNFVYDSMEKTINYSVEYFLDSNKIDLPTRQDVSLPNSTISFTKEGLPTTTIKDAGNYRAVVTLLDETNFEIHGNNYLDFVIEKLDLDLNQSIKKGLFSKFYCQTPNPDPELKLQVASSIGESLQVTFDRETGEKVGFYDLLNPTILNSNNYNIVFNEDNDGFEIKKSVSEIVIIKLDETKLSKVYDGNKVESSEEVFQIENIETSLSATITSLSFTISKNSRNVGVYEIILAECISDEYVNFELEKNYSFEITKKSLTLNQSQIEKDYDQTNTFDLNVIGIVEGDQVSVIGSVENENYGNDKPLSVAVVGLHANNYALDSSFENLKANILRRKVMIFAEPAEFVYGSLTSDYKVAFDILGYDGYEYTLPVDKTQFIGQVGFEQKEKYTVGSYEVTRNSVACTTNNYDIVGIESAFITVSPKPLSVSANFNKVYDGTDEFSGDYSLHGVIDGDDVSLYGKYDSHEVGERTITLSLTGADASNYVLEKSSYSAVIDNTLLSILFDYDFERLGTNHSVESINLINVKGGVSIKDSGYNSLPNPTAVGYVFAGWFDKNGNEWTVDTVVNPDDFTDNQITLVASWQEGEVEVIVNVITYSKTNLDNYVIHTMNKTHIDSGYFTIDGQSYYDIGNSKLVRLNSQVSVKAIANNEYVFDGFFLSADKNAERISTNDVFAATGNELSISMNNEYEIFARFHIETKTLTLDLNAEENVSVKGLGDFERNQNILSKLYDINTQIDLSVLSNISRDGFEFVGYSLAKDDETSIVSKVDLSEDTCVYAVWKPLSFVASFHANTGDEDESLLNSDKGAFENPTRESISKSVIYGKAIGEIEVPKRKGYTFGGWFANLEYNGQEIDQNTIYSFHENKDFYAKWIENEIIVSVTFSSNKGGSVEVVENDKILEQRINESANNTSVLTVVMKKSAVLSLIVKTNQGYQMSFENLQTQDVDFVFEMQSENEQTKMCYSRMIDNLSINIFFKSTLSTITASLNDYSLATMSAEIESKLATEKRASQRNDENIFKTLASGQIEIYAFTEEEVLIIPNIKQGYKLGQVSSIDGTVSIENGKIKFSNFKENCQILIEIVPDTNQIEIISGYDYSFSTLSNELGLFSAKVIQNGGETISYENISSNLELDVLTGSKIQLEISPNYGFKLSSENWTETKQNLSASAWVYDLSRLSENIVTISGFDCSGRLLIPFERVVYSLTVETYLFDETFEKEQTLNSFATANIETEFDKDQMFYYGREISVTSTPNEPYGYVFKGYFSALNENELIQSENNLKISIEKDTKIFAVVELKTYLLEYDVLGKGDVSEKRQEVKHGKDAQSVVATADEGYSFDHWEVFNGSEYVSEAIIHGSERTDRCVVSNQKVRAVFVANQISISVSSKLILYYDENLMPIYDSGDISSLVGTKHQNELNKQTILSKTDNVEIFEIYANAGYHFVGWTIVDSGVEIKTLNESQTQISGFTKDFSIVAVFETDLCEFEINLVSYNDPIDITKIKNSAGNIYVSPQHFVDPTNTSTSTKVKARTKQSFTITANILFGYQLALDENQDVLVGYLANGKEFEFIENIESKTEAGMFSSSALIEIKDFVEGGRIFIFVKVQEFDVDFVLDETNSKTFKLTLNSNFSNIDQDYKVPYKDGYKFNGWFSEPHGNGVEYINNEGLTINRWNVEHSTLYAHWTKAYVTLNVKVKPGDWAVMYGSLAWVFDAGASTGHFSEDSFQVYVGHGITFDAYDCYEGYKFSHYELNGNIISLGESCYVDFPIDETNFVQELTIVYSVRSSISLNQSRGTTSLNGENIFSIYLLEGQSAMFVASPFETYEFEGWLQGGPYGKLVSTEKTFVVSYSPRAYVYHASFIGKLIEVEIEKTSNGEVVSWLRDGLDPIEKGGKTYARYNETIVFTTTADYGYRLDDWLINGERQASRLTEGYTLSASDAAKGKVVFKPVFGLSNIRYQLNFDEKATEIYISGAKRYSLDTITINRNDTINLTIKIKDRYKFVKLEINTEEYDCSNKDILNLSIDPTILSDIDLNHISIHCDRIYWRDVKEDFQGRGTIDNPYKISTPEQAAMMSYLINNNVVAPEGHIRYASAYYVLSAPINLKDRFWTPIGTKENPFDGTMEFKYFATEIYPDRDDYEQLHYNGLFGYITDNARFIENTKDYITGVIVICSFIGLMIIIGISFAISKHVKKKKLQQKQNQLRLNSKRKQ